jgi:LPS export ABC transporter protein LptC
LPAFGLCATVVPKLHMERIAAGITLAVILFVTVVVGVLIVRGHRAAVPREEIVSSPAEQQISEIHIQEDGKLGAYRWRLDAERADSFPGTGKTLLRKVTIGLEEPDRSWKATSDEGELVQETRDVELRGNVVLVSSEGLRVETTILRWANAEGRAWTEQPVTIYRSGGVVKGTGLETRPSEEITLVRGRVSATFGGAKAEAKAPAAALPVKPAASARARKVRS